MSSGNTSTNNNTAPATPPAAKPSDKQMNLLAVIMQNVQGKPDINWTNVVTQSGLKNERTAKEMYRQMTKKFGWANNGAGSPSGTGGGVATPSPTKVQKRTGKVGTKSVQKAGGKNVKKEVKEEVKEDEDEDELV